MRPRNRRGVPQPPHRRVSGTVRGGKVSKLEQRFALPWRSMNGPVLEREFRFYPIRKWRSDFAHLPSRTLIEIEGGGADPFFLKTISHDLHAVEKLAWELSPTTP